MFKGMDPDLAKVAMDLIVSKKAELDATSSSARDSIQSGINSAFSGEQVFSMQGFVERLNAALQNLYKYLDGESSSFAQTFNEIIASYQESDANVASGYDSTNFE